LAKPSHSLNREDNKADDDYQLKAINQLITDSLHVAFMGAAVKLIVCRDHD